MYVSGGGGCCHNPTPEAHSRYCEAAWTPTTLAYIGDIVTDAMLCALEVVQHVVEVAEDMRRAC